MLPGQALQRVAVGAQGCGREAGSGPGPSGASPAAEARAIALPPVGTGALPGGNHLAFPEVLAPPGCCQVRGGAAPTARSEGQEPQGTHPPTLLPSLLSLPGELRAGQGNSPGTRTHPRTGARRARDLSPHGMPSKAATDALGGTGAFYSAAGERRGARAHAPGAAGVVQRDRVSAGRTAGLDDLKDQTILRFCTGRDSEVGA